MILSSRPVPSLLILLAGLSGSAALAQAPPAPVAVDVVRSETVESTQSATGTVYSRQELLVRAAVPGRLSWIREAGESVQAGEVLARIDATPLILQREERQARIRRNEVQLQNLEDRLQRFSELQADDYYSDGDLTDLRAQRDLARGDLEIARVQIRQLDDQIERATIRAPFAGIVTERNRHAAEEVTRGEQLARLVDTTNIELRAQLPLSWLWRLERGDMLQVQAGGRQLLGTIRQVIPDADRMAQTFEARIDLPAEASSHWAVGQLTAVHLPTALQATALLVPRDALVLRREAKYVYRITTENTAEQVMVELGAGRGDWIVVEADLTAGDRVAVRGAERLADGQSVEIIRDLASERASQAS